jgi:hypothetical protein
MWDIPRFRIRAYVKSLQDRRKRAEAGRRPPLHFRRTEAQLTRLGVLGAQAEIAHGRVVLNDLRPNQLTLFTNQPLEEGLRIALTITHPEPFYVKARVRYCRAFEVFPRIVARETYPYRVKLEFFFDNEAERETVERYCAYLNQNYLPAAS